MPLADDLRAEVRGNARGAWPEPIPKGLVVPTVDGLTLGNTGKLIDATVLYADLHGSTKMVDHFVRLGQATRAAEYYKAFLTCSSKIIRANGGSIVAYDGDRVMAIYVGQEASVDAVFTALKITSAVTQIINPEFESFYGVTHRLLRHTVGIDRGTLLAVKAGVRNDNDMVWVGPAANYAAKLNSFSGLEPTYPIRATEAVVDDVRWVIRRISDGSDIWDGPYREFKRDDGSYLTHFRTSMSTDIDAV